MSECLPAYSVLMSVYEKDHADYLDAAVRSMVEQTVAFQDIVIVCDGPLGVSLNSCIASWERELGDRVRVLRIPGNVGLGGALAKGLPLCSCDVVARMDADDISRPERCEALLARMVSEDLDLVGGAIEEFDAVPGDMGSVRRVPLSRADIEKMLRRRNPFNHMTVIFSRRAVLEAGGYQPFPWMEDYWLWARMIAAGCRCGNVPDVVVDARVGSGMYARRSNLAYLRSQVRFFSELRGIGLVGRMGQCRAVLERSVATLLPLSGVRALYNKALRERAVST